MYNHNGSTHGYNTRMVYYPAEDLFIAILGNNEDVRSAAITCDLEALVLGEREHVLGFPIQLTLQEIENFAGEFKSDFGNHRSIIANNNRIFYRNGKLEFELIPLSQNLLCFSNYEDIRLEFDLDKDTFVISSCSVNPETYVRN